MDEPPVDIVDRHRTLVIEVEADICDACPAEAKVQAFVYIELPSQKTLAMCAHHGTQHWEALVALGAKLIDLRYLIEP